MQFELTSQHLFDLSLRITREMDRLRLGVGLGLEDHVLQSIMLNSRGDVTLATYGMLKCWYRGTADKRVAWEELTEALKKASLNFLINDVFMTEVIDIHILTASKYAYFYFHNLKLN